MGLDLNARPSRFCEHRRRKTWNSVYHNCPWFHSESVDHDTHSKRESVVILHLYVQRVLAIFIHIWDEYNYHQNIKRIHPYLSHSPYSENTIRIDCTILSLAPASSSTHSDFVSRFQSNHGDENHLVVQAVRQQGSRWVEKLKSWVSLSEDLMHLESFIIIYIHIRSIISFFSDSEEPAAVTPARKNSWINRSALQENSIKTNGNQLWTGTWGTSARHEMKPCGWEVQMYCQTLLFWCVIAAEPQVCHQTSKDGACSQRLVLGCSGFKCLVFLKQMQTQVVLWRVAQCNAQIGCMWKYGNMYTSLYIDIPSNAYLNGASDDKPVELRVPNLPKPNAGTTVMRHLTQGPLLSWVKSIPRTCPLATAQPTSSKLNSFNCSIPTNHQPWTSSQNWKKDMLRP